MVFIPILYRYRYLFKSIWEYGYKTADNAARVIQASQALYNNASDDEKQNLICIWLKLML